MTIYSGHCEGCEGKRNPTCARYLAGFSRLFMVEWYRKGEVDLK